MSLAAKFVLFLIPLISIIGQGGAERNDRNFSLSDKWIFETQVLWPNSKDSLAEPRIYLEYELVIEVVDTSRDAEGRRIYDIKYDPGRILPDQNLYPELLQLLGKDSLHIGIVAKEYENGEPISIKYVKLNQKGEEFDFERRSEFQLLIFDSWLPFWLRADTFSDYADWFPTTWLQKPNEGFEIIPSFNNFNHAEISEFEERDTLVRELTYYQDKRTNFTCTVVQRFVEDSSWWVSYERTPLRSKVPTSRMTLVESYTKGRQKED